MVIEGRWNGRLSSNDKDELERTVLMSMKSSAEGFSMGDMGSSMSLGRCFAAESRLTLLGAGLVGDTVEWCQTIICKLLTLSVSLLPKE